MCKISSVNPTIKLIIGCAVALTPVVVAASHGFHGGPDAPQWMVIALSIAVTVLTGIIAWEYRRPR